MKITFHEEKREKTLAERGLDFAEAVEVFVGSHFTLEDDRKDYGETRFKPSATCAQKWSPWSGRRAATQPTSSR